MILNRTLQQVKKPDLALQEALRVGKKVIVSIPNFAYYKARASIFFRGWYQWLTFPKHCRLQRLLQKTKPSQLNAYFLSLEITESVFIKFAGW